MVSVSLGGLVGYIDSTDVAFDGREMGVFMVLMAILGGKGTLWGPVIGATIFHIFKEGFWTFFLGWQYVALGVLIVVIVIYFPEGIMGWLREKYCYRYWYVVRFNNGLQCLVYYLAKSKKSSWNN